jgi:hypothetical protein
MGFLSFKFSQSQVSYGLSSSHPHNVLGNDRNHALAAGFLGTAAGAEGCEHRQGQQTFVNNGGARMVKVEHGVTF